MTAQALLDALHEELLVDVRELVTTVAALKVDLPEITGEVLASAGQIQTASRSTVEDFRAMGQGLMKAMRSQLDAERNLSALAARETAAITQAALSQFTRYLWLILGVAGFNTALLIALLATR